LSAAERPDGPGGVRRRRFGGVLVRVLALLVTAMTLASPRAVGQSLVVGGKDFTEQLLVAEMTTQLLRAKGFKVHEGVGFTTGGVRRAHEAGVVDVYWEYTGTSLTAFHGVRDKLAPDEAYERVKQLDAKKGLVWLRPSKVDNTYALAMRRDDAARRRIHSISDLAAKARAGERFTLATNGEFLARPDGFAPLQQAYGFTFAPDAVTTMASGAVYEALRRPSVFDVGVVFATDGRVPAFELILLHDDRRFFPSYLLAPVVRSATLERHPELAPLLEALSARLDDAMIAELNAQVDVHKRAVEDVASDFLRKTRLLTEPRVP
jgi:osmoprotectant transport system substrate-binding protein